MFPGIRYDVSMCPYISMVRNPSGFWVTPHVYFSCVSVCIEHSGFLTSLTTIINKLSTVPAPPGLYTTPHTHP